MKNLEGSLIVGYSFSEKDIGTIVVGRQEKGNIDIINVFHGEDARALLDILTTKPEEKNGKT